MAKDGNLKEGNAHDQASKEPPPDAATAVTAGSDKDKANAEKQGHQGVLTQNNQQASDGAHAVSDVGAVDPLKAKALTTQQKDTTAYVVDSPNFYLDGQGPFPEGETLYLTKEQAERAKGHLKQ